MNGSRRVVVTGYGAVTPLGATINKKGENELWENLKNGKCAIKDVSLQGVDVFNRIKGAEIENFDIANYLDISKLRAKDIERYRGLDKMIQFAVAGTKLCMDNTKLKNLEEVGFYTGNAMQGIQTIESITIEYVSKYAVLFAKDLISEMDVLRDGSINLDDFPNAVNNVMDVLSSRIKTFVKEGIKNYDGVNVFKMFKTIPPTIFNFINYAISGQVASHFQLHGPTLAVNSACSAGSDAIGNAYRVIKSGDSDVMISGGSEAPIAYSILAMFNRLKIMSKNGVKPGDIDRDGFALGEGAGYITLEELEHSKSRGAKIYSEVVAYSQSNDAMNMIALHPEGKYMKKTIHKALEEANLNVGDVDYINPHGTSTKECDPIESKIIKDVFGKNLENISVNPTKCLTGHFQAGAGAVEAVIINKIYETGFIPGTKTPINKDASCIDYVAEGGLEREINVALSTSMGFGGHNAVLIFKRYSE